ncbi:hypothetical protein COR50_13160 [Chitinophaga caeni]|uniref:PhnB-like domain-containing protein n=1 Tax=Chitinophaga caeni TaxID=2029983 RepID=A0A291QVH9_9BACT|nr:VOC family protein [Chitinophaga caeni]ATL48039.1 hypothetical protein COR50_13160 [Chitinophaga caeni]
MNNKIHSQKLTPNLWFTTNAEEAVNFYVGIFKNSSTGHISRYGKEGFEFHGMPEGTVLTMEFKLEGQSFLALNGNPNFTFNESISFIISCENQEEVDYYWEKLSEGGDPKSQVCGWLKDKFGVSWQVVPAALQKMMQSKEPEKQGRMMGALMQMKKLDIAQLEAAYNG